MIEINGKKYKVTENLGFQAGYQVRMVEDNGKERAAVKRNGRWAWWTAEDRLDRTLNRGGYYDCV